jgi:hypothetical protein
MLLGCLASAVAFAPSPVHMQRFELRGSLALFLPPALLRMRDDERFRA